MRWLVLMLCMIAGCGGTARPRSPRPDQGLLDARPHDASARADEHRARGKALFDTQQFERAIAEFQAGYDLVRWPLFLFNIAQARKQLGDCRAVPGFRVFLDEMQRIPADAPERAAAEPGVEVAKRNLAQLGATCPTAMALPTSPRARRWYERRGIVAAMTGGLVVAGVGGGLLALGDRAAQGARRATTLDDLDDDATRARWLRRSGGATLALGLALSAAAYVYHLRNPSLLEEVTVEVGPGRTGVALRGRF